MIDDGPVYRALSVHLFRANSITHFDDRHTKAMFSKYGVWDKIPEESTLILEKPELPLKTVQDGRKEAAMSKTNSICSAVELQLVTDRHRAVASTCTASRG